MFCLRVRALPNSCVSKRLLLLSPVVVLVVPLFGGLCLCVSPSLFPAVFSRSVGTNP